MLVGAARRDHAFDHPDQAEAVTPQSLTSHHAEGDPTASCCDIVFLSFSTRQFSRFSCKRFSSRRSDCQVLLDGVPWHERFSTPTCLRSVSIGTLQDVTEELRAEENAIRCSYICCFWYTFVVSFHPVKGHLSSVCRIQYKSGSSPTNESSLHSQDPFFRQPLEHSIRLPLQRLTRVLHCDTTTS